ncbi:hypothetical protein [Salinispora cortesiana]|uniref:hypothetical protein n=1 Tax=Salinispora cortesiana TaxID=1305843 RepID=UPI000420B358|nr:hypothetical protein [Salinispora cortesiana]
MRIRLHGTASELTAALAALTHVLDIHHISRPYLDRPPSTHHRIYLHATPRACATEGKRGRPDVRP